MHTDAVQQIEKEFMHTDAVQQIERDCRSVAQIMLDDMCRRDFDGVSSCLDPHVELRALLPHRFLEEAGRDVVTSSFRTWFEPAHVFHALGRSHIIVAGRSRLTWRFEVSPHPGTGDTALYVIEQTLFCDERQGSITAIDLLCSGFRPVAESAAATRRG
jgi:hypothetical protein